MVINNSKKISELRSRDTMTTYPQHSWIPLAQYNPNTASYTNISMNVMAILSYCIDYNQESAQAMLKKYHIPDWAYMWQIASYEIGEGDDAIIYDRTDKNEIAAYITYSPVANVLSSYISSYTIETIDYFAWEGYPNLTSNIITKSELDNIENQETEEPFEEIIEPDINEEENINSDE